MRQLLALALARDGFRIIDACDGAELERWIGRLILRASDDRCVDLIVADQRMPNGTGLEVLARLRHCDWSTPFILITAFGDGATHAEAARLGVACVLDKPFDLEQLRSAARALAAPGAS
jgi:DNA-binding response OmpR family regulator